MQAEQVGCAMARGGEPLRMTLILTQEAHLTNCYDGSHQTVINLTNKSRLVRSFLFFDLWALSLHGHSAITYLCGPYAACRGGIHRLYSSLRSPSKVRYLPLN